MSKMEGLVYFFTLLIIDWRWSVWHKGRLQYFNETEAFLEVVEMEGQKRKVLHNHLVILAFTFNASS